MLLGLLSAVRYENDKTDRKVKLEIALTPVQSKRLTKQLSKIDSPQDKPYFVLNLLNGIKSWFSGDFAFTNYQPI